MAKLNVYVPDDLRGRMDKAKDMNWSQVACEAFERKLGELAAAKEKKNMKDVIQRLKASKVEDENQIRTDARRFGEEWARDTAKYIELKRLAKYMERSAYPDDVFIIPEGNAYTGAEIFAFVVWGCEESEWDRALAVQFWELVMDNDGPEDEFVQGFAQGAVDVYREVENQL